MRKRWLGIGAQLLVALGFAACSSDGDGDGGGGSGGAAGSGGCAGADCPDAGPSCDPSAISGPNAFTDRTEPWGLGDVDGNRLTVVDLDVDGYPDLVVHAVSSNRRSDLGPEGRMLVRVLMNRPADGGGRTFVDRTVESGLFAPRDGATDSLRSAQLAVFADIDNDGDPDAFSGTYTDASKVEDPPTPADLDRSEVMINDGTATFSFGPPLEPHASLAMPTSGATFADVDRDGNVDLFIVGWYEFYGFSRTGTQARLHLGNGDGTFREVTADAGLLTDGTGFDAGTNHRPAYGVTSCDTDGDGSADLLVSAYGRQLNQHYLNDGSAVFRDVGMESGFAGDEDRTFDDNVNFLCYCTAESHPDCPADPMPPVQCPSPASASWSPTEETAWRNNGNTFSTVCADITGDGTMDLFNAEIAHWWAGDGSDKSQLLVGDTSSGALRYTRPDREANGTAWPHPTIDWNEGGLMALATDIDNDARLDVVVAASDYPDQYSLVFRQKGDGTFEEIGEARGLHHACASGLAAADFDRDGDVDIVVGSGRARDCSDLWETNEVHLYENDAADKGNWLQVSLRGGAGSNVSAIGARVTVTAGGVSRVQEVGGGYGHFGMQDDAVLHFGLGDCETVESVSVRWPDSSLSVSERVDVAAGQRIEIAAE